MPSQAPLSAADLPPVDPHRPAWPARTEVLDGCGVRVRHAVARTQPGEPAVFVHGLGGDATNWTELMALLGPWLDSHALDLPGFGGSDPAPGGDYSLTRHARTVVRLIERIIERGAAPVHLFGNSLGGAACVLVAARRPDLVRTLTLVSPAMPALRLRTTGPVAPMQALLLPGAVALTDRYLARYTPEQRVRGMLAACFGNPAAVPPHRLAEVAEEMRRRATLPWATAALVRSLRGLVASYLTAGPGSLWARAGQIGAPTLVAWGGRDRLVDVALAPRTARAIPGSTLLVLPECGHVAQMEDPVSVARAFLAMRAEPPRQTRPSRSPSASSRVGAVGTDQCERLPR